MKSIAKLKDQARLHEQKEEWDKAIRAYEQALQMTEASENGAELNLLNRIGDLHLRLGRKQDAVRCYEEAADRYADSGFFNNAIALCNKAMRYEPESAPLYLKLGRFCAAQGFFTDARRWFLKYAERQQRAGDNKSALSALEEFADASDDPEIRELIAQKLEADGAPAAAAAQLVEAFRHHVANGNREAADALRERILRLDPGADLSDPAPDDAAASSGRRASERLGRLAPLPGLDVQTVADSAGIPLSRPGEDNAADAAPADDDAQTAVGVEDSRDAEVDDAVGASDVDDDADNVGAAGYVHDFDDVDGGEDGDDGFGGAGVDMDGEIVEHEDIIVLDDGGGIEATDAIDDADAGEDADALPLMAAEPVGSVGAVEALDAVTFEDPDFADDPDGEVEEAEPLPMLDTGEPFGAIDAAGTFDATEDLEVSPEIMALERAESAVASDRLDEALEALEALRSTSDDAGLAVRAIEVVEAVLARDADRLRAHRLRVEYATRAGDSERIVAAHLDFAGALERAGAGSEAAAHFERVLERDPENESARQGLARVAPRDPAESQEEEEYVDLGVVLAEELTRASAKSAEPDPDAEDADFLEQLSRFQARAVDQVADADAGSHYDLGLAFKEMGLYDEAITAFRTALRGGEGRLKIYEELGQCLIVKGEHSLAVRILGRALRLPDATADDLLGVNYHLGRCYEELGQHREAREAFERVVEVDGGFRDVRERLARL